LSDYPLLLWIIGALLTVTGFAGLLLPVIPEVPLLFLGLLCGAWARTSKGGRGKAKRPLNSPSFL